MIKSFLELYALDLNGHANKKPSSITDKETGLKKTVYLDYLSWSDCIALLYENGAEDVDYGPIFDANGNSVHLINGDMPEVRVYVSVDGKRREIAYAVSNGNYAVKIADLSATAIHRAIQRAFVKCVATNWGLGLKLWHKEEETLTDDDKSFQVYELVGKIIKTGISAFGGEEAFFRKIGINSKTATTIREYGRTIDKFMASALKVMNND